MIIIYDKMIIRFKTKISVNKYNKHIYSLCIVHWDRNFTNNMLNHTSTNVYHGKTNEFNEHKN